MKTPNRVQNTLLELERLKPILDVYVYQLCVHYAQFSPNTYESTYDLIDQVERWLEPCPF